MSNLLIWNVSGVLAILRLPHGWKPDVPHWGGACHSQGVYFQYHTETDRQRQTMTDRYAQTFLTEGELATAKVWNLSLFEITQKHGGRQWHNFCHIIPHNYDCAMSSQFWSTHINQINLQGCKTPQLRLLPLLHIHNRFPQLCLWLLNSYVFHTGIPDISTILPPEHPKLFQVSPLICVFICVF